MFAKLYWLLPTLSALVWLGLLLGLLLNWVTTGKPHYPSESPNQRIPYISDTGAYRLKPLFIAAGAVTVILLDLSLLAERWLRHTGRLAPNTSWFQKFCSFIAIIASWAGAAGLILLSCFDTYRHPTLHDHFLILFLAGYVVSAIFMCLEFQRLGSKFTRHPILKVSFYIKLVFIIVEIALAIPFGIYETGTSDAHVNTGAIIEWTIALIFTFYVFSYIIDLLPAVRHSEKMSHPGFAEMGITTGAAPPGAFGIDGHHYKETGHTNGHTNGYTNGYTNGNANGYTNGDSGYTNGTAAPSRNF